MRKIRILLFICASLPLLAMASGNGNLGRLAKLLEQMTKREEVTPDSFFSDVLMLRQ